VRGFIDIRAGAQGCATHSIRIELIRIEQIGTWVASHAVGSHIVRVAESYKWLHNVTESFPFDCPLPLSTSLPPSIIIIMDDGVRIQVRYMIDATVCVYTKKGFLQSRRKVQLPSINATIQIQSHNLHSAWPVYVHSQSQDIQKDGLTLTVQCANEFFGRGDKVSIMAALKTRRPGVTVFRAFEMSVLETITLFKQNKWIALPSTTVEQQESIANVKLFVNTQHKANLSCVIPLTHAKFTVIAKRIRVTYAIQVKATLNDGTGLTTELPIKLSQWSRTESIEMIRQIGFTEGLSVKAEMTTPDGPADESPHIDHSIQEVTQSRQEVNRFRLLIMGKSGCGKTTILSKICGENMADRPGTTRGYHDINKEIVFQTNDKLVAHDSEGFEAGQHQEVKVVTNFIKSRAAAADVNDRLHMIWYCIEMNSRPIQRAEKDFFSTFWKVPIIAVMSKFDTFVQDILQGLEEAAEANGEEIDDVEFSQRAVEEANLRFNKHYSTALLELPYPPTAVVALSEVHNSTPKDSRLANLVQETMKALQTGESDLDTHQLSVLFVSAQKADVTAKLEMSIFVGMGDFYKKSTSQDYRSRIVNIWSSFWSGSRQLLLDALQRYVDTGPGAIGDPASPQAERHEVSKWASSLLTCCQAEQMVADMTLIMEQIFLLKIDHIAKLKKLLGWYRQRSLCSIYVRNQIMTEHRSRGVDHLVGMPVISLVQIVCGRPSEIPQLDS